MRYKEREIIFVKIPIERYNVDDKPCCFMLTGPCCVFLDDCGCNIASYTKDDDGMPRPNESCPIWK